MRRCRRRETPVQSADGETGIEHHLNRAQDRPALTAGSASRSISAPELLPGLIPAAVPGHFRGALPGGACGCSTLLLFAADQDEVVV